jgi:16S rRNA (guanine(527)-N(7))-methyltransferase RsmG
MTFAQELRSACRDLGLPLSDTTLTRSLQYRELLRKWNARINLLAVSDDRELVRFHFAESFWATRFLGHGLNLTDVGAGAGFPGLAMALYRTDLQCVLLEKSFKKAVFLETVIRELGLSATVVAGDATCWPGWPGVQIATVRALKLWPELLSRLETEAVELLHFRGPVQDPLVKPWTLRLQEVYPLSRERVVACYSRPADVPRGTR